MSDVLTVLESMMPTVGWACFPAYCRTCLTRSACKRRKVPSPHQRACQPCAVRQCGKTRGNAVTDRLSFEGRKWLSESSVDRFGGAQGVPTEVADVFDQFPLTVSHICWKVRVLHKCDSFRVLADPKRESCFFTRSAERAVIPTGWARLGFSNSF